VDDDGRQADADPQLNLENAFGLGAQGRPSLVILMAHSASEAYVVNRNEERADADYHFGSESLFGFVAQDQPDPVVFAHLCSEVYPAELWGWATSGC
jgi:hypothetical protein